MASFSFGFRWPASVSDLDGQLQFRILMASFSFGFRWPASISDFDGQLQFRI